MSQPTYLNEKSEGDQSMSVKRGTDEAFTSRYVPQDSHTMVKADCLKPSSQGCHHHPLVERLKTTSSNAKPSAVRATVVSYTWQLSLDEHGHNEDWQENEQATYRVLTQGNVTKNGIAYGPRGLWHPIAVGTGVRCIPGCHLRRRGQLG